MSASLPTFLIIWKLLFVVCSLGGIGFVMWIAGLAIMAIWECWGSVSVGQPNRRPSVP